MNQTTLSENWKPVVGYEDYYQVSNLGRVRSLARMTPLVGSLDAHGYHKVTLWTPHGQATKPVHRLVCEAFNGPPNILHKEVAHLDGTRRNNRADNLKWVSHAENVWHKRLHGTHGAGENHPRAKLTDAQARAIIEGLSKGKSASELAAQHGISGSTIYDIRSGKSWRHIKRPPIPRVSTGNGQGGADNHGAALTWDQAREIRDRKAAGESAAALRLEFGISKATICKLLAGKTYREAA